MPFWQLYYHIVWATKDRLPLITSDIEGHLHQIVRNKVASFEGELYAINGTHDHIHIAASIPPTIALAKFIGEIKGAASFHINHSPKGDHTLDWQRGYGAISFRDSELSKVVEYILAQKQHHADGKISKSLEDCGDS
jgi:putative transposase